MIPLSSNQFYNKLKAHPSLPSLLHLNYLQVVQMKHDTNCCIRSALFTNKHLNTCMLSGRRLVIAAALPASVTRHNTCLSFTVSPDLCYCLPLLCLRYREIDRLSVCCLKKLVKINRKFPISTRGNSNIIAYSLHYNLLTNLQLHHRY